MSVESLAVAMHHSQTSNPTTKWVLAGIANHDGDGGSWPTIATLAKYALCSERTAQRAVAELVALGEVEVVAQAGGTREWRADKRPNLYRFLLRCPANCDRSSNHRLHQVAAATPSHGVTPTTPGDADGVSPVTERGDTGDVDGVTPPVERGDATVSPKPSLEPSMEGGGHAAPASTSTNRPGSTPLRSHHLPKDWRPTTDVTEQMRSERPDVDQELELVKFRDHYADGVKKRDWSGPWRNWIRNTHRARPQATAKAGKPGPQPGYYQDSEQIRRERLARAGDLTPPAGLTVAQEQAWLREARRRIADGLPLDDIGDAA